MAQCHGHRRGLRRGSVRLSSSFVDSRRPPSRRLARTTCCPGCAAARGRSNSPGRLPSGCALAACRTPGAIRRLRRQPTAAGFRCGRQGIVERFLSPWMRYRWTATAEWDPPSRRFGAYERKISRRIRSAFRPPLVASRLRRQAVQATPRRRPPVGRHVYGLA